jgi:3-hydroxyacyl-CoA dehydrogenase
VRTPHFWNPAHLMPLVEIAAAAKTSRPAPEAVRAPLAE